MTINLLNFVKRFTCLPGYDDDTVASAIETYGDVMVNGKVVTDTDVVVKPGDQVSVRRWDVKGRGRWVSVVADADLMERHDGR